MGVMLLCLAASSCFGGGDGQRTPAEAGDWPLHGRDEAGQRFSPLTQIDARSIGRLGLAWQFDLGTEAGQEATPIVQDGVIYIVSAYDVVHALDAETGRPLWSYDPEVRAAAARSCCGPVSRGVAVAGGRVFVGALDGRLIALDARTGKPVWQAQTIDPANPLAMNYTITGAPRVVKNRVIIGNAGAEFGARGYVSAYDARTGELDWRFYTVPGAPGVPDRAASDQALARAARTWSGQWWRQGGGGTVWDAIAYDPELDLLYIGVGNGSPTNQAERSEGKGDNLFLASIVALRPDTGAYVWHYQQNPGESWDYTATQNIVFADVTVKGRERAVLMQAPKNGFFYMLDRATGELLSAEPYAKVNWATHVDIATGRPAENPAARYYRTGKPFLIYPSSGGAHNWPPMAYSPRTGLVYIPVQDVGLPIEAAPGQPSRPGVYNTGVTMAGGAALPPGELGAAYGSLKGYLLAWDPEKGAVAWRRELPAPFNGGVLATAGGLVFQGNVGRQLVAYDANDGRTLWTFDTQVGVVAPPITYQLDDVQYIAVLTGIGGAWPMLGGQFALKAGNATGPNRLLVFRLGGKASLPPPPDRSAVSFPAPPPDTGSASLTRAGDALYGRYCLRCHGIAAISASFVPDLRHSGVLRSEDALRQIVLGGALSASGMPRFDAVLTSGDLAAIRSYLVHRANEDRPAGRR